VAGRVVNEFGACFSARDCPPTRTLLANKSNFPLCAGACAGCLLTPMTQTQATTRDIRAVLGFLLKAEVDAIFKQQPLQLADQTSDPARCWRNSAEAVRSLEAAPHAAQIGLLNESVLPVIKEIRARRTFAKYYDAIDDYQFALAPINALLTPQWLADMDYIKELADQINQNSSLEDLIRFCMSEGTITEPIISGTQVIFSSNRPNIHADQVPFVREVGPGEFEVVIRANSRPNYVQVAAVGGRLLLTNGVHHVCALLLRGFESVPCVVRNLGRIEESGLNLQSTLFRPELMSGPRPALVKDFLSDRIAIPLKMRSVYHIIRIAVGVEPILIPAVAAPSQRQTGSAPVPVPLVADLTLDLKPDPSRAI
jgi:hypothetical protein